MKTIHLGVVFTILLILFQWGAVFGSNNNHGFCYPLVSFSYSKTIETPTALNDTLILAVGCGNYIVSGNVLDNDKYNPDLAWLSAIGIPKTGKISYDAFGNFTFSTDFDFRGEVTITYRLSAIDDSNLYSDGKLTIYVEDDFDCDNIINRLDLDNDNDGILDFHEGDLSVDTDGDGIANCYDIDSDNDGITDFTEWQNEDSQITLLLRDENSNGWDDAFDSQMGGIYYEQVDTDLDGSPDFLDIDSDNDGILDFVEAYDILNNKNPEFKLSKMDHDRDGLDNSCDTINCEVSRYNPIGSNSPLPDHNKNGIRDWRERKQNSIEGEDQDAKSSDLNLLVYPNPFANNCILKIPINEDYKDVPFSLKIYDINGKLVHLELLFKHQNTIHLEHLLKGIYFVHVKTRDNSFNTKLIKSD